MTSNGMARSLVAGAFAVWAVPFAAHAQVAAVNVAPPPAEDLLAISAEVSAEYDSNVARTNKAGAALRGIEQEDFLIDPSISIELNRAFGRHRVALTGNVGYDFHVNNTRLNREHVRVDATAVLNFARCGASITAGYNRQQSDLRDINIIAVTSPDEIRANAKNLAQTTQVSAIAGCGAEVGLRPVVFGDFAHYTNSALLRRVSNYDSYTVGAGVQYVNPVLADISVFGAHSKTDYPDRNAATTGGVPYSSGYKANRIGLRVKRDIGAALAAVVEIAYSDVDAEDVRSSFDGVTWRGEIKLRPNPNLQFVATLGREVTPSRGVFSDYDVSKRYGLTASYVLSPRATLTADYFREDLDHRGVDQLPGAQQIVFEHYDRVSAGVSFDISRRLSLLTSLGYERRNANGSLYDYDSIRASIAVQTTF